MSRFSVRSLYESTVARLAELAMGAGDPEPLRSYWGSKKIGTSEMVPNAYLWVPRSEQSGDRSTDPTPNGWRVHHDCEQVFQVRCYGEDQVVAQVMLRNLAAILAAKLGANLVGWKATWADFVEGEELVANGELLLGEFTTRDPADNAYVHVAKRVHQVPQTLTVIDAPTAQPTGFEIRFFTSPDGTTDGELLRVDTVTVPTP